MSKTFDQSEKSGSSIYYRYDLFVVEIATREGKFMFKFCKNPGVPGKCDFCY